MQKHEYGIKDPLRPIPTSLASSPSFICSLCFFRITELRKVLSSPLLSNICDFSQGNSTTLNSFSFFFASWVPSYPLGFIPCITFVYYEVFPDLEHTHNISLFLFHRLPYVSTYIVFLVISTETSISY